MGAGHLARTADTFYVYSVSGQNFFAAVLQDSIFAFFLPCPAAFFGLTKGGATRYNLICIYMRTGKAIARIFGCFWPVERNATDMKNAKEIVLTSEGLQKLQDELDNLKLVKRKEISEQLKIARSFGDLSENSEYDEAKNAQAMNEARILELELTIKNARVIEASEMTNEKVHMGSKVRVFQLAAR